MAAICPPLLEYPAFAWPHASVTTYGERRFSARDQRWRYIRYRDGNEELYDHDVDPHEFENLASDTAHESTMDSFRSSIPESWPPSLGGRQG